MQDLLDRKMEIVKEHLPQTIDKLTKANKDTLELVMKALKDRKINAQFGLGIIKKIKAEIGVESDSSIKMNGEQKLEAVKMAFENARATINTILDYDRRVYESYFKSIDEQLQLCRNELEQIDEELKKAEKEDKKRKAELKKRRKELFVCEE